MIIACPSCLTGYLLPEHLLGPGGARVRCPHCQHLFAVAADGRPTRPAEPAAGPASSEQPLEVVEEISPAPVAPQAAGAGPAAEGPLAVARAVLDELAVHEGEALERACAERRLFAEFGPALMLAYETYRRRAGDGAGPGAFREALRERWGVELVPLMMPRA